MTKQKIENLTPAQIARLTEFREKWTSIALSTEPAERLRAEGAIRAAYTLAGLQLPQKIVWCGSPPALVRSRELVRNQKVGDDVGTTMRVPSVWKTVKNAVEIAVWGAVGAAMWDFAEVVVRTTVWEAMEAVVGSAAMGALCYGQHDAGWLGCFDFFKEVCGLHDETAKAVGLIEIAKSAGWFLPHREICWVSERYQVLTRDERGELHSLTGPAVVYPDGWKIYAVHGMRVPEYVIERPHELTTKKIEEEKNIDIRRVMIERYGTSRYLLDSGAKPFHADQYGTLYRKEVPGDEPLVMVKVVNSTPEPDGSRRRYFLRVPLDIQTAHAAVAWTFGLKPEDYHPLIET